MKVIPECWTLGTFLSTKLGFLTSEGSTADLVAEELTKSETENYESISVILIDRVQINILSLVSYLLDCGSGWPSPST